MRWKDAVVIFAMDGAIGHFDALRQHPEGANVPPLAIRAGIRALAWELFESGARLATVSTLPTASAEKSLRKAGIRECFDVVIGENEDRTISGASAKEYDSVARGLGITNAELAEKGMVIGESESLRPAGPEGLTFVSLEAEGGYAQTMWHADVFRAVIAELLERGDGNVQLGFQNLLSSVPARGNPPQVTVALTEGIRLDVNYSAIEWLPSSVPVVDFAQMAHSVRIPILTPYAPESMRAEEELLALGDDSGVRN